MISFGTFADMEYSKYDQIWMIVNKLKTMPNARNVFWHPELGPSHELFAKVQRWKKNKEWDQNKFDSEYVSQFLWELKQNRTAIKSLKTLCKSGIDGNILVVCYCSDENFCHRRIIKGLTQGAYRSHGLESNVLGDNDSQYYDQYLSIV